MNVKKNKNDGKPTKKRLTKREKAKMQDLANKVVVQSGHGSMMYLEQRSEEVPPVEEARTFLRRLVEQAHRINTQMRELREHKKGMILEAGEALERILIADNKQDLVSRISTYISKALQEVKGFVTDRYIRKCLPERYKDPEQLARAESGGTSSADTKETEEEITKQMQDIKARAEDPKGPSDYQFEELADVTNVEILRDIAKYHYKRAQYFEDRCKGLEEELNAIITGERKPRERERERERKEKKK